MFEIFLSEFELTEFEFLCTPFFGSHTFCIGVVSKKLVAAKVKISSYHLKFCKGCFNDISKIFFFPVRKSKVAVKTSILMIKQSFKLRY